MLLDMLFQVTFCCSSINKKNVLTLSYKIIDCCLVAVSCKLEMAKKVHPLNLVAILIILGLNKCIGQSWQ